MSSRALPAVLGGTLWLAWVLSRFPAPTETGWAVALLLLVPFVLVPLAALLRPTSPAVVWLRFLCAVPLLVAFGAEAGVAAALLAAPWVLATTVCAFASLRRILRRPRPTVPDLVRDVAEIYLAVGAAWLVAARLGLRPLDFEHAVVLLTAIHFHHAGFALSVLASEVARARPSVASRVGALVAVAAVPLVAVGITATQLHGTLVLETAAAWLLSLATVTVALLQGRLALDRGFPALPRVLWAVGAAALFASMGLAVLYAGRGFLPVAWLDLPTMRAYHGTANALLFALPAFLAWALASRAQRPLAVAFRGGTPARKARN
jgi:hypothetical protein